jgi:hypothetical protein
MLRVPHERYKAGERAAGDQPVSTWLGELADQAAKRGRRGGGGEAGAAMGEPPLLVTLHSKRSRPCLLPFGCPKSADGQ